jgi:predicted transcriptional regulator
MKPPKAAARPSNRRAPCHGAQEAEAAVRRSRALELRITGMSERRIASVLGVSQPVVHGYLVSELADVKAHDQAHRDELREIERERLEMVLARWLPIAVHPNLDVSTDVQGADGKRKHIELADYMAGCKAAELVVKISARLSALDGLDAPTKTEHSGTVNLDNIATIKARLAALADRKGREVAPALAGHL